MKKLIYLIVLFFTFCSLARADINVSSWLEKLNSPSVDIDNKQLKKVSLQLKWLHQFQFAGYYAALELGYYRDAGLDVTLIEGKPDQNLIDNVLTGKSEFGVGTSDLLLQKAKGYPVVVLAVIFQHSPIALMYKKGSNIDNIHDIVGKKVAMDFAFEGEIDRFLHNENIEPNSYTKVPLTSSVDGLINGDIDVMSVYSIDEPFYLQEKEIAYGLFSPREGGIDFYGDNLFTTQAYLEKNPQQVKAFVDASIKGWLYAMDHPEEIADLILRKYSQRYSREHLLFQHQQMLPLIQPKLVEMGYMHEGRWRHIANTYSELKMLPADFPLKDFMYEKNPRPDLTIFYWSLAGLSSALLLFWGLSVQKTRLNRRLRIEITQEVEKSQQQKQRFIEQLEHANKQLEEQVKIRTARLNNTLEKLQTLLNNSGEGFLAFGSSMQIDEGYSEECRHLFDKHIAGEYINKLLFPNQATLQANFAKNIQRILYETDDFKQAMLLSLLPSQFTFKQKIIAASYRLLSNQTMMVKLVDITEAEALKQQLVDEKKHLLFVVEVVSDAKEFFDLKQDYQAFIEQNYLSIIEQADSVDNAINHLYLKAHTFKGVFLQKALLHTPEVLHQLETDLSALKTSAQPSKTDLIQVITHHALAENFHRDLMYLQTALGENYFGKEGHIQVHEQALKDSIAFARQLINDLPLSSDNMLGLIHKMQRLRFMDIKTLLASHIKTVQYTAIRLKKNIAEMTIEGDSVLVDPDYMYGFNKALIHIFRNIVDHGIELPEQREEAGKPEQGKVSCRVSKTNDAIIITISDDGAGIDCEKLKQKCRELELYSSAQLDSFSEQQYLGLIFEQNLSTAENVSLISGQGVGLAVVRSELEKIRGDVIVDSILGQGSCFTFSIPINDSFLVAEY